MVAIRDTSSFRAPCSRRDGFALIVTIMLVAFLVLVLVGLATFTRVETQVASNSQQVARARQNALLALNIAIGQLQKHTGPDQRVSARADILLPSSVTVTPPTFNFDVSTAATGGKFTSPGSTGREVLTAVETYWGNPAAPRNRHWTGVWRNTNTTAYDREAPAAFNPKPGHFIADDPARPDARPVWLVSGSESPTAFDPTSPVLGLAHTTSALDDTLRDSANSTPHRLLVGAATVVSGATVAGDVQRYVTAPQMPIKGVVPGFAGEQDIGHYAWWIGDEGIKARADLIDPFGRIAGATSTDPDDARNLKRRQSAQRPVIESMTTDGADGLAPFFDDLAADARLRNVLTPVQLRYLDADDGFHAALAARYHDLSIHSRGVLADTKHGGLKRDLSYILSRPSETTFRAALNDSGYNVAPDNTYNVALSSAATPYATIPPNEPNNANGDAVRAYDAAAGILAGSATWEQLRSFYRLGDSISGKVADARPASGTEAALHPLLAQAKLFYSMEVTGGAISLRITPVVVLGNPYSVALRGKYRLTFAGNPRPIVLTGKLSDPAPGADALSYSDSGSSGENLFVPAGGLASAQLDNGGLCQASLVIDATIPAGVAQIFSVTPGRTIHGKTDAAEVPMINTFDPSAYVTVATGLSINTGAGDTHAALYATGMAAQLHLGGTGDANRIAYLATKSPTAALGAPVEFGFVVYPVAAGFRRGGGIFSALYDGKSGLQQAPFLQTNYRGLMATYVGASGYGDHPLQWGTVYGVRGAVGDTETDAHPRLSDNILPPLDEDIPATTRWGLVNSGEYPSLNTPPPEIADSAAGEINILYDVPRADLPITSLGQLQHFNLAGHLPGSTATESVKTNAFLVNYPISNSYPGPRVRRHKVFHASAPFGHHYDASYLWNDVLWDRFTFSSYPQSDSFTFGDDAAGHLVNSRYRPFRPDVAYNNQAAFRGVHAPARNLLVEGAFNINSTSVEAWKALFSALKGVPVGTENSPAATFARTLSPVGGSDDARTAVTANAWNGFTELSQDEITELAEEMVLQIRLRGPFLSLTDFVNRRLVEGPSVASNSGLADPHRLGLSGALQAAIDRAINRKAVIPDPYRLSPKRNETTGTRDGTGAFRGLYLADLEYRAHSRLAGYPGYLLQGDVLSAIGPNLSARSDTFTIRTYGDVLNPATGLVEGRAWCEAVVQRFPDYVTPASAGGDAPEATPAAGSTNERFGRRYQIVGFRWLDSADI